MAVPRNRKRGQDVLNPVPQPPRQRELPMPHLPKDWEGNEIVRRRILWDGRLLAWPKAELIGVASYKAASLNEEVLTIFFNAWVAECDAPKSPGVPLMKEQARVLQCLLLHMCEVSLHAAHHSSQVLRLCKLCGKDVPKTQRDCDGWGLRKLFSHFVKRLVQTTRPTDTRLLRTGVSSGLFCFICCIHVR